MASGGLGQLELREGSRSRATGVTGAFLFEAENILAFERQKEVTIKFASFSAFWNLEP